MTPAKINAGEPTVVKRDPSDQNITSEGQTKTIHKKHKKSIEKEVGQK